MAYYVSVDQNGRRFLNVNKDTGEIYLTTCPHGATLFTSSAQATRLADQVARDMVGALAVAVMSTRLWEPNVVRGFRL